MTAPAQPPSVKSANKHLAKVIDHPAARIPAKQPATLDLPPHSEQAEEFTLGALMMNWDAMSEVAPLLSAGDFYFDKHGWVYQAMCEIYDQGKPLDPFLLAEQLRINTDKADPHANRLEAIGGEAYLAWLPSNVPTALHARLYAEVVKRFSVRRALLGIAGKIATLAYDEYDKDDGPQSVGDLVNEAQRLVFNVDLAALNRETESYADVLTRVGHQLADYREGIGALAIDTPLSDLNHALSGFYEGELIILAAGPKRGKTSLMLQCAIHAAQQGSRVLFYSLEMRPDALVRRRIAQQIGISYDDQQRMNDKQWAQFLKWLAAERPLPVIFDTNMIRTPVQIMTAARKEAQRNGLDLIIVDYLQLMATDTARPQNRNYEIGEIARRLKLLAMELKIPIILASQFSREVIRSGRRPQLYDLRDSGEIEQHLDSAIFIHDPAAKDQTDYLPVSGKRELVYYTRNHGNGVVNAAWVAERTMFANLARDNQNER